MHTHPSRGRRRPSQPCPEGSAEGAQVCDHCAMAGLPLPTLTTIKLPEFHAGRPTLGGGVEEGVGVIRCQPSSPSLHPPHPLSPPPPLPGAATSLPALLTLPPPTPPSLPSTPIGWRPGSSTLPVSRWSAADSLPPLPGQVNWLGWVPLLRTSAHRNFGSYFGTVTSQFSGEVADVATIWADSRTRPHLKFTPRGVVARILS